MALKLKITERDKRTIKFGAVGVVLILGFFAVSEGNERWQAFRAKKAGIESKLSDIKVDPRKRAGLLNVVPVFEMPEEQGVQEFLFRDKLNEQLKRLGIKNKPLEIMKPGKMKDGYRPLNIKFSARCRFSQVMDLLAALKENPYFVAVEELRLRVDAKKRQEVDFDMTVSTFVK